ncbi:hypothetical protein [Ottowia thiooxydans]|uniref:Uncharacterized protein n=1 Tax=Ottowia thiooxydans TaxID=219182 RepID=A0ABV2Q5T4_9BURK
MKLRELFFNGPRWACAAFALLAPYGPGVFAHEPVARCWLLDEDLVRCRGLTNDGDALPGAQMDVMTHSGLTVVQGKLDRDSTLTFRKPQEPFYVLFEIGPGLQAIVEQEEIRSPSARERKETWLRR